jgi:hypothetical protein
MKEATLSSLAYIHGRLEAQIEIFATALGVPTVELAQRMGSLLSPPARGPLLGTDHRMPDLRQASTQGNRVSRPLALAGRTHGRSARQSSSHARSVKTAGPKNYWDKLTAEERAAEMARRVRKRKTKTTRAAKAAKKKTTNQKRNRAKQKIYQARHSAKKAGTAMPDLPSAAA